MSPKPRGAAFVHGCAGGLVFGSAWLATEGFFHSLLGKVGVGAAMFANFGLAGLPLVLVAACVGVTATLWAPSWWPRVLDYLRPHEASVGFDRAALLLCVAWCALVVALGTLWAGPWVFAAINTPVFAAAVLLLLQLGFLFIAACPIPLLHRLSVRLLGRVARQRALRHAATPIGVAATLVVLATLGSFFAIPATRRAVLSWDRLSAPVVGLLLTTLSHRRIRRLRLALSAWATLVAALGLLVVGGLGAVMQPSKAVDQVYEATGVAVAWLRLMRPLLDVDGDGHLGVFGGRDCAAFDPARHPGRPEIPNNGVDEDCSGSDLKFPETSLLLGRTKHAVPPGLSKTPNIVLVTADGLSYLHTSLGGYERTITPGLVALAERATSFKYAFSTSSATDVSFPALMTGRYPLDLALKPGSPNPRPFVLAEPVATLASELKRRGYRTVCVAPSPFFLRGSLFVAGFDQVLKGAVEYAEGLVGPAKTHTGERVSDEAIAVIEASQQPLFLWVHYYDMHWPYETPRADDPIGEGDAIDKYDAEVRFADRQWTRVFEAAERRFAPQERLLIFTADHGEAFDEQHHDNARHNAHLHMSEIRVPFIIQGPWRHGDQVDGIATHLDLWPTLANLLQLTAPPKLRGESLVPALAAGKQPEKNLAYGFFYLPNVQLDQVSVLTQNFHLLAWRSRGVSQMFRWQSDTAEDHDIGEREALSRDWLTYLANQIVEQPRAAH